MTPELPAWIWPAVSWGATYLLHSSLLIVGVWCGVRLKPSLGHGTRETLWKMALVGGVVTSLLQTVWVSPPWGRWSIELGSAAQPYDATLPSPAIDSQNSFDRLLSTDSLEVANPLQADAVPSLMWRSEPRVLLVRSLHFQDTNEPLAGVPSPIDIAAAEKAGTTPGSNTWVLWPGETLRNRLAWSVAAVGLLAVAWGLGRALRQSLNLRRRLANCVPVTGGLAHQLLSELRARIPGCPEVLLLTSDEEHEPAAFGLFRWTILLPERAERELSSAELSTLLAHELAHLVRGDAVWLAICRLCCSCLAFQPLNQLARREWQKSAEFLSDVWAVNHTGQPLALARCLTEVAGWRLAPGQPLAALAATGRRSGLAERVEQLLQDCRPADPGADQLVRRRTGLLCLGLLAAIACGVPRLSLGPAQAAEPLPRSIDIEVDNPVGGQGGTDSDQGNLVDSEFEITEFDFEPVAEQPTEETPAVLLLQIEVELGKLHRELYELQSLVGPAGVPPRVEVRLQRMQVTLTALSRQRGALRRLIRLVRTQTGSLGRLGG